MLRSLTLPDAAGGPGRAEGQPAVKTRRAPRPPPAAPGTLAPPSAERPPCSLHGVMELETHGQTDSMHGTQAAYARVGVVG